jgi:hypothetical protein
MKIKNRIGPNDIMEEEISSQNTTKKPGKIEKCQYLCQIIVFGVSQMNTDIPYLVYIQI